MRPLIKTEDLEVTYNKGKSNEFLALRGVNIEIYKGEYIVLFGTSGSGKSTLMNCILGSLPNSGGRITVKDKDVYSASTEDTVKYQRETVGIMFQTFNLIPSVTVLDNVALPQLFAGVSAQRRLPKAQELLERFGVGHVSHKLPGNLSGGQQQRVSVARSLVNNPEILLADEPVGNLDSRSATQVMNTIDEVNKKDGVTIILVTHDAKHLPYAHRVYYLEDGHIVREVPNPEQEQIKKTDDASIVTEIERLARLYPYVSVNELRVKSLVNYITQDVNFDQVTVLEKTLHRYIHGSMNDEQMKEILMTKMREGGVGLEEKEAEEIKKRLSSIMKQSNDITRFRRGVQKMPEYYQWRYIQRVRDYLLDLYEGDMSVDAIKELDRLINDRLNGVIRRYDFEYALSKDIEENGVGIDEKSAYAMTEYFEKIITQGVAFEKVSH